MKWCEYFEGIDDIVNNTNKTYKEASKKMYELNKYQTMKKGIEPIYCKELKIYYMNEVRK